MLYKHCNIYFTRLLIFPLIISAFLLSSLMLNHCHAQVTTDIASDGTMGTTVTQSVNVYNITDGTLIGNTNLFHSFDHFSVGNGDIASFNGTAGIANILSRVTGGVRSDIYGTLRSTIDGANLYLLNPSGVVFGPSAILDVKGSFHVSTADYLRFSDGAEFHADLSKGSTLTVAPVAAFGFLGDNPVEPISIEGSTLEVPEDKTLSVIGGDIKVNDAFLGAESGRINIASVASSVASQGEVVPNAPGEASDLQVDSFSRLGKISLSQNAILNAGGDGGGTVIIRGGRFIADDSNVYASTWGPAVGPLIGGAGAGIDIQVTNDVVLDNGSFIGTNVFQNVAPGIGSGGVRVKSESLEVANFSALQSAVYGTSTGGNGGDINVDTKSVLVRDQGSFWSGTGGVGDGTNVTVNTGSLEVRDGGQIFAIAHAGTGNAGDINIKAESILVSDNKVGGWTTMITTQTWGGTGNAGNLKINTDTLDILGNENMGISNITWAAGQGGKTDITVSGDTFLSGTGDDSISAGIFTNTWGSGTGGVLNITTNNLELTNAASLQTATFAEGTGGDLNITATNSIKLNNRAFVTGRTEATGDAGKTTMKAGSIELKDGARINVSSISGFGGNAGSLDITADSVFISGFESAQDPFGKNFTGLTSSAGKTGGNAGDIHVTTDSLVITQRGAIQAANSGPDQGGYIKIDAGIIQLLDGANILANTWGTGDAGNIEVNSDNILISGVNSEPYFHRALNKIMLTPSSIVSQTGTKGGNAGDITITAGTLKALDGGGIGTDTLGPGNGGNIDVNADSVLVAGENRVLREFLGLSNTIEARSFIRSVSDNQYLASATGNAGDISITSGQLQVEDKGLISTSTVTPGAGGDISISVGQDMLLRNEALISANSFGVGNAGNIAINAGSMFKSESSSVTTESSNADGGNINVTAGHLTHLVNSEITSSVGGGPDTAGGNITLNQPYVVMDNSKIIAQANEGRGGGIQITADVFIADHNSVVSASSAKGVDGEVDIRATVKNISGNIGPLKEDFSSAHSLLLEPCAVRLSDGNQSSLVVAGRDGLPARPGDLLPSPLYDSGMAKEDAEVAGILDIPPLAYGINFFEDKGLLPLDMMEGDTGCMTCPE